MVILKRESQMEINQNAIGFPRESGELASSGNFKFPRLMGETGPEYTSANCTLKQIVHSSKLFF